MQLLNFFKSIFSKLVDRIIADSELNIVRCVIHPFHHHQKKGVVFKVFTPPRNSKDVSLIRLNYSSEDIAKRDGIDLVKGKLIPPIPKFAGLVIINNKMVNEVNSINVGITASIKGTPIKNNEYVPEGINIYRCDKGKPYHADLVYSEPVPDGEPSTKHREYCDNLLKIVSEKEIFFEDKCPEEKRWCGKITGTIENKFTAA